MAGLNLIPREQRRYVPTAQKELFTRSFWLATGATIFIGIFSISLVVFSTLNRKSYTLVTKSAEEPTSEVWVKKSLTRCAEEWHKRKINMETYLESQGIKILQKQVLKDPKFIEDQPCEACFCPSGEVLYLKIARKNLEDLEEFVQTQPPESSTQK